MAQNSNLSIEELEKLLTSDTDCIDSENGDFQSVNNHIINKESNKASVKCLVCEKEFDCSHPGTDPINLFCSLCNATLSSFPHNAKTSTVESSKKQTNLLTPNPMEVDEEKKNDASEVADKDNIVEDDNAAQYSDEDKDCQLEELPSHEEIYQQEEMSDYTGFKDGKELGDYFVAAKLQGDDCNLSLHIGNLNSLVFMQSRDPNNYAITGRHTFWKLSCDPYARATSLKMYGYDLYDAWLFGNIAIVCYCMIMGVDGFPIGNILFKIGRTRCAAPRVDGFVYDIREDK